MKKKFIRFQNALLLDAVLALIATMFISTFSAFASDNRLNSSFTVNANPYQEVIDAGILKYVGTSLVQPSSSGPDALFPNIDVFQYSKDNPGRGPLCMSGSEFFVETRDGSSNQLLMFLEGGGVCLSEICIATPDATISLRALTAINLVGIGGVLDHYDIRNPLANFNVVHVPYCDGAIFMGDADRPLAYDMTSSTPKMAYQRGLQNLTAAFEVAKRKYPNPSRIVLAGTSGGGYGIMAGMVLARYYYPQTPIVMIADSGAPMLRDNDKDFVRRALVDINAIQYVPLKSCPDCIANGHVSKIFAWALERDKNFRLAIMSHSDDFVIGDIYMKSPPPIFRNAMLRESASLTSSSNRVHRFITLGRGHTYLLNIFAMDFMMDIVGGVVTSDYDFPADVNFFTLYNELLGGLTMTEIDQSGKKITGYQWINKFLNSPATLKDVVNLR